MKPLRIAVIGAGHLGKIHARLLKTVDGARLVGIVDPVPDVRRQVAVDLDTGAFASHVDLVGQIDAAIIATPTRFHHAVGMELLKAGVHLFIEKPIASTVAEARELVSAARRARRILQVGHVERFNPAWTSARPFLSEARYIEAVREGQHTFRSTDIGVVLDLMIHDIDLVMSVVDSEIVDVNAIGFSALGQQEDVASAQLVFVNGCEANLRASRVSFAPCRAMQVFTDTAWSHIDFAANSAKIVQPGAELREQNVCLDKLSPEEQKRLKDNLFSTLLSVNEVAVEPRNAILDEQHDFVISIRSHNQPSVSGEDGLKALSVAHQILSSIKTHGWNAASKRAAVGPAVIPLRPESQRTDQRRAG